MCWKDERENIIFGVLFTGVKQRDVVWWLMGLTATVVVENVGGGCGVLGEKQWLLVVVFWHEVRIDSNFQRKGFESYHQTYMKIDTNQRTLIRIN